MKKIVVIMLSIILFVTAVFFISGCNGGSSPAEDVYHEETGSY